MTAIVGRLMCYEPASTFLARLAETSLERLVRVDEILQGQAAVDKGLDRLGAEAIHVPLDSCRVVGHLVDHLPIRVSEVEIVLEEVTVPVDVGHHDLLIHTVVAPEEIGIARVVVDHHLIDLGQPILVALGELFELHSEAPVGIPERKPAIRGDLIQASVIEDLEDDGKKVQPEALGVHFDLVLHLFQLGGEFVGC